jgi:hypothetical protein
MIAPYCHIVFTADWRLGTGAQLPSKGTDRESERSAVGPARSHTGTLSLA